MLKAINHLPEVTLVLLTIGLGYGVFQSGGVLPPDWNITLVVLGAASVVFWLFKPTRRTDPPRLSPWLAAPLIALPIYALLQLVPLPESALRLLSPARAEQLRAIYPLELAHSAPLSTFPPATVTYFFQLLAYFSVLLIVRQITWLSSERRWAAVIPLFVIGTFEAGLGMVQISSNWPNGMAQGTYVDRDHFAGLLEMLLPLAVMYAVAIWRRADTRLQSPALPAVGSAAFGAFAALLLLGIIYSLSRMGFLVSLCTLIVIAILTVGPRLPSRRTRLWALAGIPLLIVLAFVFLPPDQLIARFAEMASSNAVSAESRLKFWHETLSLIRTYPVFGCGLGAYESAFRQFQAVLPTYAIDAAHNDYLQFAAELGIVGSIILATLVAAVLYRTVRAILEEETIDGRYLAIGCLGSMLAMLLHSLVDFNLQIPANALTMAWICGIPLGLQQRHRWD